jgi:hypothetical protein
LLAPKAGSGSREKLMERMLARDLVHLRLQEAEEQRKRFEERYQMAFEAFRRAWNEGQIPNKHSYEVERDYWEWEAAVTDEKRLRETLEELP